MKNISTLLAITAYQATLTYADDKCRALCMSGGANNGAWEAGVVWGLLHYGNPTDFEYDVITGVSAGALNTGMFATFAKGDELDMSEKISDVWASVQKNSEIFDTWDGSWPPTAEYFAKALFNEPSMLNSAPAIQFITDAITPQGAIKRHFTTAAVDANTGEYVQMNQDNCTFEDLPVCAMASGSIPVVLQPQLYKGHVLMDGGTVWNENIDAGINQCIDMGYDTKDIIVDVVLCYDDNVKPQTVSKDAAANLMDARAIGKYYVGMNSIANEIRSHNDVEYRYYFGEYDTGCQGPLGLMDFRNSTTWCLQEVGRNDAKQALDLGQDKIRTSLAEWFDKKELQTEYPYFKNYLDFLYNLI